MILDRAQALRQPLVMGIALILLGSLRYLVTGAGAKAAPGRDLVHHAQI